MGLRLGRGRNGYDAVTANWWTRRGQRSGGLGKILVGVKGRVVGGVVRCVLMPFSMYDVG